MNWGQVTIKKLKTWIARLQENHGDKYDRKNLRLSVFVVRASVDPNLLNRVIFLTGPIATDPELLLIIIHQVSFITTSLVRSMCNKIGAL